MLSIIDKSTYAVFILYHFNYFLILIYLNTLLKQALFMLPNAFLIIKRIMNNWKQRTNVNSFVYFMLSKVSKPCDQHCTEHNLDLLMFFATEWIIEFLLWYFLSNTFL